jgi:hypothetical protein
VPLTNIYFAAARKVDELSLDVARIIEGRDVFIWREFEDMTRAGHHFLGLPVKYRDMVEKANMTFKMSGLSSEESAARFKDMCALCNQVNDEYNAGGASDVTLLYSLVRLIVLVIITKQNSMILDRREVSGPLVHFVKIIDDENRMLTDRMPHVVCPPIAFLIFFMADSLLFSDA